LIAVVERAEREVVVEFGVPLFFNSITLREEKREGLTASLWEFLGSRVVRAC
jgi:hypothetical protein